MRPREAGSASGRLQASVDSRSLGRTGAGERHGDREAVKAEEGGRVDGRAQRDGCARRKQLSRHRRRALAGRERAVARAASALSSAQQRTAGDVGRSDERVGGRGKAVGRPRTAFRRPAMKPDGLRQPANLRSTRMSTCSPPRRRSSCDIAQTVQRAGKERVTRLVSVTGTRGRPTKADGGDRTQASATRPTRTARPPKGAARADAPLPATELGPAPALLAGGRDADEPAGAEVGAPDGAEVTDPEDAAEDAPLADAAAAKSCAL